MDKEKIIEHFGAKFYNKVLNDLEKYANIWGLSDFEQVDYYSVNCIFKCVSSKHGLCVLKIGNPSKETNTEYHILKEYSGRGFCGIYEADIANGVLLVERITPGNQLRAEPDLDKRLDIFCGLFRGLHIETADKANYPTYMQWVSEAIKNTREQEIYEKMAKAEQICRDLCVKYPGEMLLHGDLHHDNILLGGDNRYHIIDPKGVIGDSMFDIPRFILNEFDDVHTEEFYNKLTHITRTLSAKLEILESDIRRLTYVELCLAQCWSADNGRKLDIEDINEILFIEKFMEELL